MYGFLLVFFLEALGRILEYACNVRQNFPVVHLRIAFKALALQHVAFFAHDAHVAFRTDQVVFLVPQQRIGADGGSLRGKRVNMTERAHVSKLHVHASGVRTEKRDAFTERIEDDYNPLAAGLEEGPANGNGNTALWAVPIGVGIALSAWWAPALGKAAMKAGDLIMWATELQPFLMGILVSLFVGIALTLPISSAAICAALGLTGLAGGAAVAGCCAQMVGFAVMSFPENKWGGLVSQGIGTSMLQMGNIVRNPRIWIAPCVTSMITGPIATCIFNLRMNGTPVSSGMGTCGLVGQIGVYSGWVKDVTEGTKAAITGFDWLGLILISFILPAVLCPIINMGCRKLGWVKDGDLKLN